MKVADQQTILIKSSISFGNRLFTILFMLLILPPIVYAQMGYYVTTWSDVTALGGELDNWSWIDPNNPNHLAYLDSFPTGTLNTTGQSTSVIGMGYTYDDYNSYNHTYWVTTNIIAPGGGGLPLLQECPPRHLSQYWTGRTLALITLIANIIMNALIAQGVHLWQVLLRRAFMS